MQGLFLLNFPTVVLNYFGWTVFYSLAIFLLLPSVLEILKNSSIKWLAVQDSRQFLKRSLYVYLQSESYHFFLSFCSLPLILSTNSNAFNTGSLSSPFNKSVIVHWLGKNLHTRVPIPGTSSYPGTRMGARVILRHNNLTRTYRRTLIITLLNCKTLPVKQSQWHDTSRDIRYSLQYKIHDWIYRPTIVVII